MRTSETSGAITARAIAGTYVVLFGISVKAEAADDLLGFSIERLDQATGKKAFLDNFLLFEQNDKGPDSDHSSELNPFQAFVWGDYTVKPGRDYTYSVSSRHGTPGQMSSGDTVELEVKTESVSDGEHSIFFNRGAASSQAYATRFPALHGKAPTGEARAWLSRGLEEAILDFIGQAKGAGWGLRASIYEFQYPPVLEAFKAAAERGADVKVVWDDIDNKEDEPRTHNAAAIKAAGIEGITVPRKNSKHISHNKFIVLLKDGEPQEVWTGSTNITDGGIFGHSNVGHLVRDIKVAAHYLGFWEELADDPAADPLKDWATADTAAPDLTPEAMLGLEDPRPPDGEVRTVFSPRHGVKALQWYAKLMDGASSSVFLTAAFGVSKQLQAIFAEDKPYLRYLLLDNRNGKVDTVARGIEKADSDNQVVSGGFIGKGKGEDGWRQWVKESLTGLNNHVQFIHTKYMLIDPLSEDPIVITGSANFSESSTSGNDENMLVIRGDTRVADVYLGEFMRLFTAFRLRGYVNAAADELVPVAGLAKENAVAEKKYLKADASWAAAAYVPGSPGEKERLLFSGA
jgi:phosphatidylserine/phosphatidylglycerophosphate/cardiolipin synthase-like enzyme